jgi:hypothetical protein
MDKDLYNQSLTQITELLKTTYYKIFIAAMNLSSEDGQIATYYEPEESMPFTLDKPFDSEDPNVQQLLDLYLETGRTILSLKTRL